MSAPLNPSNEHNQALAGQHELRYPYVLPWLFGSRLPFFSHEVKEFYECWHHRSTTDPDLRPRNPPRSWCVGPVVILSTWMPVVHIVVAVLFMIFGAKFSHYEDNQLSYDSKLWALAATTGLVLLSLELHIAKYSIIPYIIKTKGYKGLTLKILEKMQIYHTWEDTKKMQWRFNVWFFTLLTLTILRLVSFFTANMFLGMLINDALFGEHFCRVRSIFAQSWGQHEVVNYFAGEFGVQVTVPLDAILILIPFAEMLHFLWGLLAVWPGVDTSRGSSFWRNNRHWRYNPYTLAFDARWGGPEGRRLEISVAQETRTLGDANRFAYRVVGASGRELTTGSLMNVIGEATNMAFLIQMQDDMELVSCEKNAEKLVMNLKNLHAVDAKLAMNAVFDKRTIVQDYVVLMENAISRLLIFSVLFCGLSLQFQITYYNARVLLMQAGHGDVPTSLYVGIFTSAITLGLTLFKLKNMWDLWTIVRKATAAYDRAFPTINKLIGKAGKMDEALQPIHVVAKARNRMQRYVVFMIIASGSFVYNFLFIAVKFVMERWVCDDRIWNIYWPPKEGCVELNMTSVSACDQ